jgi:hypothetical protein
VLAAGYRAPGTRNVIKPSTDEGIETMRFKVHAALLAAAGSLVLACGSASGPALAASTRPASIVPGQIVKIENENGGKCLDMTGGSSTSGTPAQIWGCNGKQQQQWTFLASDGGTYLIMDMQDDECLSVENNVTHQVGLVIQHSCNFSGSDAWENWYVSGSVFSGNWGGIENQGDIGYYMHPDANENKDGAQIYVNNALNSDAYNWGAVPA